MDEMKIKAMLSKEVLSQVNGTVEYVLRNILFDSNNKIDWNEVYNLIITAMPELSTEDQYKVENMMEG